MFLGITGISNAALDILIGALLTLLTVAVLFFAVYLIIKFSGKEKGADVKKLLIVVLVVGFLLRFLLSIAVIGHRRELFETIYATLKDPDYFIDPSEPPSTRLYPLTFYLIGMFAYPLLNGGLTYDNVILNAFIKLPFVIADVVTAYLLYRAGKKFANEYVGVILAALVCFCPIFIFASSLWGSIICLLIPIFVGAFLCLVEKKYVFAILIADLALLVAKEGMIILPVMFAYFLVVWIKSVIDYFKFGKKEVGKNIILIPLVAVLGQVLIYLISLPYTIPISGATYADFVELFFIIPIKDNRYFGENALNIYSVFGFNTEYAKSVIDQMVIAIIFAVFIAIITGVVYLSKRNRAVIVVFATYAVLTVTTYFVGFTALSVIPVLGLLLLSYVTTKDKRFIKSFCITSILLIVLTSVIYIYAGYYNVLPIDIFQYSKEYTGGTWLVDGAFKVIMIVLSVLHVINHIYLTFTTFDITINNSVKKFNIIEEPTVKDVMKEMFAVKKANSANKNKNTAKQVEKK